MTHGIAYEQYNLHLAIIFELMVVVGVSYLVVRAICVGGIDLRFSVSAPRRDTYRYVEP